MFTIIVDHKVSTETFYISQYRFSMADFQNIKQDLKVLRSSLPFKGFYI